MKILITDVIQDKAIIEKKIFGNKYSIKTCNAKKTSDISDSLLASADGVLAFDTLKFDKKTLKKLKKCKVLVRVGVGFDNVDIKFAKKIGIPVCNVPDYGVDEVADYAISSILFTNRNFLSYIENTKKRKWIRESNTCLRLDGKTIGIIGLGRIGSALAMRAKVFKLKVIFYDPYVESGKDKVFGIERVNSLKELAIRSDFISIHCPLTIETENMIDKKFFNFTKKNLILINSARGKNIDLDDLRIALKNNKLKCAVLDVLPVEPLSESHLLLKDYLQQESYLKNRLFITPHSAFFSNQSIIEIREKAAQEAKNVIENKKSQNCINNFYE
jgi:phosphoglycerate dehydrogenase-like enzyme